MRHAFAHPLAGKTVQLKLKGTHPHIEEPNPTLRIEDWWDRVSGGSWMKATGNPAAMMYGIRSGMNGLPTDDEVVYGKVGSRGHLIHVSEIGDQTAD